MAIAAMRPLACVRQSEEEAPEDAALMGRIAGGDDTALRLLAERHTRRILRVAQKMLGSPADADEIAQEALLRIWTHAGDWRPARGAVTTWIYTIVYRLCLDRLRRRRETSLEAGFDAPDPAPGPLEAIALEQDRRRIAAILLDLPPRQRAALVLFYFEEMSGQDAAAALGVSLRAFWSLLQRARQYVQDAMLAGEGARWTEDRP